MENFWEDLVFEIKSCTKCKLAMTRNKAVPGEGLIKSPVMFIGEAPGADEDDQGRPFVGRAGQLMTKMLQSVNINREDIYITNVVKCRPPENRLPEDDEIKACYPYLESQVALVNPKIIVTVGATATRAVLKDYVDFSKADTGITKMRGKSFNWDAGIVVIPIFHPSYLLRYASTEEGSPKWLTWQDMKMIKSEYDRLQAENEA